MAGRGGSAPTSIVKHLLQDIEPQKEIRDDFNLEPVPCVPFPLFPPPICISARRRRRLVA